MLIFADNVGGWGWQNADVSKKKEKISKEKNFSLHGREKNIQIECGKIICLMGVFVLFCWKFDEGFMVIMWYVFTSWRF